MFDQEEVALQAISPIDGRYRSQTSALSEYFSEMALIKHRVLVEVEWLIHLSSLDAIPELPVFSELDAAFLRSIYENFNVSDALDVKHIEHRTNHDVKAVEYFLRERLAGSRFSAARPFLHFACTSEDISNLAYALICQRGIAEAWHSQARLLVDTTAAMARDYASASMLARTHGQAATPTTLGKEVAVFVARWRRQLGLLQKQEFLAKINGAVGAFNAHLAAYPRIDWERVAADFVVGLGLTYNPLTTQIEPHDSLAECFHTVIRFNNITIDFDRDIWSYVSVGYLRQKPVEGEVGSSTMPHKVNPIDFENSEANAGISNALFEHLSGKLPISRLQRDLSDTSALRNIGVGIAHSYLSVKYALRGLAKVAVDRQALDRDLEGSWEVLGEAIQTIMRKAGYEDAYERLKDLTRGSHIDQSSISAFIAALNLPPEDKQRLLDMTPSSYTGLASKLVDNLGPG